MNHKTQKQTIEFRKWQTITFILFWCDYSSLLLLEFHSCQLSSELSFFFWKRRIRRRIGGGKRICKSIKPQVIIHPIITMNQLCKVCGEPAAGYHFGAFTCEGCKVSWICVFRFRLNLRILYYCSSIVGVRRGVISVLALGFNVCFFFLLCVSSDQNRCRHINDRECKWM